MPHVTHYMCYVGSERSVSSSSDQLMIRARYESRVSSLPPTDWQMRRAGISHTLPDALPCYNLRNIISKCEYVSVRTRDARSLKLL